LAVVGLTAALEDATPEKGPIWREKLDSFQARRQSLLQEQAALIQSSPARQSLLRIDAQWQQLRAVTGLPEEEAHLQRLLLEQGRRSSQSGDTFERVALELTREHIRPELLGPDMDPRRVRVLRGVTLGASRVEFDQLAVLAPPGGAGPVEVLAAVEVKRN